MGITEHEKSSNEEIGEKEKTVVSPHRIAGGRICG